MPKFTPSGQVRLRTIVVTVEAQRELDETCDLLRIDEALAGLSGAFEQHPERFPVADGNLRVGRFLFRDGSPPIRVLFETTDDEITVVAAQVDPEQLPIDDN